MIHPSIAEGPIIHVLIGQVHVARKPHILFAVLGSCVGVSIIDRFSGLGGMAHVLLPQSRGLPDASMPGKYADLAVDCLIDTLIECGAMHANLVAFMAGGAALCGDGDLNAGIGIANAAIVDRVLKRRKVPIAERHLGGNSGRKVTLRLACCEHSVEELRSTEQVLQHERAQTQAKLPQR
jgi:chemotaxis protein CheD